MGQDAGLPYCTGKKIIAGINDLLTLEPELCKEWSDENELDPLTLGVHSNKKAIWVCGNCGCKWEAIINNRTGVNRTGCPYCDNPVRHMRYENRKRVEEEETEVEEYDDDFEW